MADKVQQAAGILREAIFVQDMRRLAFEVKALTESIRHLDVKVDILQENIDELFTALRMSERLGDLERAIEIGPQAEEKSA
jgi:hypothetical protein